ncbi:MAG: NAD(P)H-dependent oxidoreductase [Pseudomonadota bacterium]
MRTLVVYCHPNPESYCAHLRDTVLEALAKRGDEVRVIDLYAKGFHPVMDCAERLGYHTPFDNEEAVADDLEALRWCDAVVFVYPTWWFGLPAMLKGWLDRVLVPHATFSLPTKDQRIQPQLTNITRPTAVTTCGASFLFSKFVGEPGRRTLLRGMRYICHPRCRTQYAALYKIDSSTHDQRVAYAGKVRSLFQRQ